MSDDLLAPIWVRLDHEPPVFFADRHDPDFAGTRDRLIGLGFLREAEPARFVVCRECGSGWVRAVRWVDDGVPHEKRTRS